MPTLNWIGKEAVINHHLQVPYRLIRCNDDLPLGTARAGNLLIEGDNLLALKALLPYYKGSIKCVYIDPPYNTGNEGWIYNDNTNSPEMRKWLRDVVGSETEDLSRHDKWLCMMYPRLMLLRELLRDDGAIFISIDDNEIAHLRDLMDEIFGASNFVTTIIWQKIFSPKNTARLFSSDHDYILVYAKQVGNWQPNLIPRSTEQDQRYANPDNDPRGPWASGDLSARNYYSAGTYPITCPSGRVIPGPPRGMYWRVSKETFDGLDHDHRIWWGHRGNNVPRMKRFLSEVKEGVVPQTIWLNTEVGNTQEAKKEVVSFVPEGGEVFITPKPTRLIKRILQIATDKDSIILDSFAGSGTTGQAVWDLNQDDGGSRHFILVEMEPRVAQGVAAERLRQVITSRSTSDAVQPSLLDTHHPVSGFRYCRLGDALFDEHGQICDQVTFGDLAHLIYFTETGTPLLQPVKGQGPLIGTANNVAYFLLWNGREQVSVLDSMVLAKLHHDGPKVIYGDKCRLTDSQLRRANVVFRQIPYAIKVN